MKKINRKFMFISSLILAVFLVGCNSDKGPSSLEEISKDSDKTHKMMIPHPFDEQSVPHLALMKMNDYIKEETDGILELDIYPNGELYPSEREGIEAVQAGNTELAYPGTGPLYGFVNDFAVLDLPFLFDDVEEGATALDGELGDLLFDSLNDVGLVGLGWGTEGMTHFTNSKTPINTIEDLSSLKLRVMENEVYLNTLKELNVNAESFAFGELYSAFQQNMFDGQVTTAYLSNEAKFYEVQDYMTVVNFTYLPTILLANEDFYNSLSEEFQQVLVNAGELFTKEMRELFNEEEEKAFDNLSKEVEINELPKEVRDQLIELTKPIYDKYDDVIDEKIMSAE